MRLQLLAVLFSRVSFCSKIDTTQPNRTYEEVRWNDSALARDNELVSARDIVSGQMFHIKPISIVEEGESEAAILRSLSHPSIIRLVDAFEMLSKYYMILEHTEMSLSALIMLRCRVFGESQIRAVARQLISALAYLEKQRIVHRAVRPDTVRMTADLRVKLGGFDIAKAEGTKVGPLKGNGSHPPEASLGGPLSCKSDVWGLGLVIYSMIKAPTEAFDIRDVESLPVSPQLVDLLEACLEVDISMRARASQLLNHPFMTSGRAKL